MIRKHWLLFSLAAMVLMLMFLGRGYNQSYIIDIRNTGRNAVVLKKVVINGKTYLDKDHALSPVTPGELNTSRGKSFAMWIKAHSVRDLEFVVEDRNRTITYSTELLDVSKAGGIFYVTFENGRKLTSPLYCRPLKNYN